MWMNRLIAILGIVASCVLASFFGGHLAYSLLYFSIGIPVVALIYVIYVYRHFKIYQGVGTRTVVKGEAVPYSFQLCNEDWVSYHSIKVHFLKERSYVIDGKEETEYCMLPGEKQSLSSMMVCNYRGEYEVGIESVKITDFFGLFPITYPLISKLKLTVLPRVITLMDSKLIAVSVEAKQNRIPIKKQEEELTAETRKYTYGDTKKMIHWKLSAKKQELMSRVSIGIPESEVLLFWDLTEIKGKTIEVLSHQDLIIESILALANYCLKRKVACKVFFSEGDIKIQQVYNETDFQTLYDKCSKVVFNASFSLIDLLERSTKNAYESQQYILVTSSLTKELYRQLLPIYAKGNRVTIIFTEGTPKEENKSLIRLFIEAHLQVVCIGMETRLEEVL